MKSFEKLYNEANKLEGPITPDDIKNTNIKMVNWWSNSKKNITIGGLNYEKSKGFNIALDIYGPEGKVVNTVMMDGLLVSYYKVDKNNRLIHIVAK